MDILKIFLFIIILFIAITVLVMNVYILAYFSHPEDTSTKGIWFYRIIVLVSLCISSYIVFAVPLDLINIRSGVRDDTFDLGLNMDYGWKIINIIVALLIIFVLPFSIITYNDPSDKIMSSLKSNLCYTVFSILIHFPGLLVLYFFCFYIEVPMETHAVEVY